MLLYDNYEYRKSNGYWVDDFVTVVCLYRQYLLLAGVVCYLYTV